MRYGSTTALILACLVASPALAERSWPECRDKVKTAADEGIFTTIDVTSRGVEVGVDPGVWRRVDYSTKMGMVWALSCLMTKGGDEQARIVILNDRNHHVMGEGYPGNFEVHE